MTNSTSNERQRPNTKKINLTKNAFGRYQVIDSCLRNPYRKYPTMSEIIEACNDKLGYPPSVETIQKDIRNMKLEPPIGLGAPIRYSRAHQGYEYEDPEYTLLGVSLHENEIATIENAIELIRAIGGSRLSSKFNHAMQKLLSATIEKPSEMDDLPVLQTMLPPVSRGFEHFDLYYQSCKERIPLSFIHFSYQKRTFRHIILHPFLIKEFDNRWYLIGYSEYHGEIRTFGLDRMSEPELLKRDFRSCSAQSKHEYLNDVYGVFPMSDRKKSIITIRADELSTHYFHAYPIHESQNMHKFPDGASEITFNLIPSIELARFILSQGHSVEILSPEWFKEETEKLKS